MQLISIRKAKAADTGRLNKALEQLSFELGDPYETCAEDLVRHGSGKFPVFFALLAEKDADGQLVGALIASPMFSTSLGGAGLYVSDLWVSDAARGHGLGTRLLESALVEAPANWTIRYLKLAVYDRNTDARRFYERLGFNDQPNETVLSLKGDALESLRKRL